MSDIYSAGEVSVSEDVDSSLVEEVSVCCVGTTGLREYLVLAAAASSPKVMT